MADYTAGDVISHILSEGPDGTAESYPELNAVPDLPYAIDLASTAMDEIEQASKTLARCLDRLGSAVERLSEAG